MIKKVQSLISVDPGTIKAGMAFFQGEELIASEQVKLSGKAFYTRLRGLKSSVESFLSKYGTGGLFLAVETQFIGKNPQSGLKVGQARGIIIASAFNYNMNIIDISPQEIRSCYAVGNRAKKEDYQKIVKLEFPEKALGEDEADAIAIGVTAILKIRQNQLLKLAK